MSDTPKPYKEILDKYSNYKNTPVILPLVPPKPALVIEETPILPTTPVLPSPEPNQTQAKITIDQPRATAADFVGNLFKFTALVSFLCFLCVTGLVFSRLYQKQNIKNSLNSLPTVLPTKPASTATPVPGCLAGDKTYQIGQEFKGADGSGCTCLPDLNIECQKAVPTTKVSTSSADKKPPACSYGGKQYQVGESYKMDCNTCLCLEDGLPSCTKVVCKK